MDNNKSFNFFVKKAEIRTEKNTALRFIIELDKSFYSSLAESCSFGALILPSDNTWGRTMFLDKPIVAQWQWDEEKETFTVKETNGYTPENVVCKNIFATEENSILYTVCVTDIKEKDYKKFFTVKGYIKYTDENGNEKIFYTDEYQTSLYRVACEEIEKDPECCNLIKEIKEYSETALKEEYLKENYLQRTNLSGYEDTEDKDKNHAMYSLVNGIKVREVTIDSGSDNDCPVEIVHFADTHLNFINERDIENGEINTISTYRGRKWQRDGHSVANISRVMEYAGFFDQTVITGDIMDYFSWGCGEIMRKMIIERDKEALLVIGNHEPAELMQEDLKGLSDKYTLDEKYERIQSLWPDGQNIYYNSKIVKNKNGRETVMIVALDDQRYKYWGIKQALPFASDIEKAREKGIPILIFQHCPMCTHNPKYQKATFFYQPGDINGKAPDEWFADYYSNFTGCDTTDYDTMMVHDLITKNYDVIKGVFCGDWHNHMYTEILAKNQDGSFATDENGNEIVIPQYTVSANAYHNGNLIKITVK